jgi:hypothetical protein
VDRKKVIDDGRCGGLVVSEKALTSALWSLK